MATPDYTQQAEDHQAVLILISSVSSEDHLSDRSFNKIFDRISRLNEVRIGDAQGLGVERVIRLRFKKTDNYSTEDNEWGDFQYHRKVLGLITVGKVDNSSDEDQLSILSENHEKLMQDYSGTLLDSRCFIFKSNSNDVSSNAPKIIKPSPSHVTLTLSSSQSTQAIASPTTTPDCNSRLNGFTFPSSPFDSSKDSSVSEKDNHVAVSHTNQDENAESVNQVSTSHNVIFEKCLKANVNAGESPIASGYDSSKSTVKTQCDSDHPLDDPLSGRSRSTSNSTCTVQRIFYRSSSISASNELSDATLSSMELKMEEDIKELVASLFWVIESRRLDKSYEKSNCKIPLPMAPFETKYLIGVDTKKRLLGRIKKQIGDLSLLAGHPSEALTHYGSAVEILRGAGDYLWLAAALEGQLVASLVLMYPTFGKKRRSSIQRNSSLPPNKFRIVQQQISSNGNDKATSESIISAKDVDIKITNLSSSSTSSSSSASSPSSVSSPTSPSEPSSCNSNPVNSNNDKFQESVDLQRRHSENQCKDRGRNESRNSKFNLSLRSKGRSTYQKRMDSAMMKALSKLMITSASDFFEKYKEACCHYAKFKNAAVIEMECSFKAARVLKFLQKYLNSSEFIQNAVFISVPQSNDERVKRLTVIADLYTEIGFHRKAAFYKRFAALQSVSVELTSPNWSHCYDLLVSSLDGYKLTLDPMEYEERMVVTSKLSCGWAGIHIQLLQELITTARKMNANAIAMRHLTFLLQSLVSHATPKQRKEFAGQLEQLSRICGEGAPVPLTLESGLVIPSVNLSKFPYVVSFTVKNLAPHLRPFKMKTTLDAATAASQAALNPSSASPFIFTPLQLNRPLNPSRKSSVDLSQVLEYQWVQNEPCSVLLQVYNHLPIELTVDHMKLLTNGVPFDDIPLCISLGAESGPTPVTLTGTPTSSGRMEIQGYSTHVLGVKSSCLLRQLPHRRKMKVPHVFLIDVVPPLPLLSLSCPDLDKSSYLSSNTSSSSLLQSADVDYVSGNYSLTLYAGQRKSVSIFVANSSSCQDQLIELISMRTVSKQLTKSEENQFISLNCDIESNLPLKAGASFEFNIDFYGFFDFMVPESKRSQYISYARKKSGTATPIHPSGPNSLLTVTNSALASPVKKASGATSSNNLQIGTALSNFLSKLQAKKDRSKDDSRPDSSLESYPSKVSTRTLFQPSNRCHSLSCFTVAFAADI